MQFTFRLAALLSLGLLSSIVRGQSQTPPPHVLTTPGGVRFGMVGDKPARPAPTLFVFATSIDLTLDGKVYDRCGRLLAAEGFISVAIDLPCHGEEQRKDEPAGLDGWNYRLAAGEPLIEPFVKRATEVLDYLISEGFTDPERVAACGTSRGGFMALHFAAAEPRVRCVAAFAPVTDLAALREFAGQRDQPSVSQLALVAHADKLAGRGVWMCIGNNDERVDTDLAIATTRALVRSSIAAGHAPKIELHVMTSEGHTIHPTAHEEAAAWIGALLKD